MLDELLDCTPQRLLTEEHHLGQALVLDGPNKSFRISLRLGEHGQAHALNSLALQGVINLVTENEIAIMEQKLAIAQEASYSRKCRSPVPAANAGYVLLLSADLFL